MSVYFWIVKRDTQLDVVPGLEIGIRSQTRYTPDLAMICAGMLICAAICRCCHCCRCSCCRCRCRWKSKCRNVEMSKMSNPKKRKRNKTRKTKVKSQKETRCTTVLIFPLTASAKLAVQPTINSSESFFSLSFLVTKSMTVYCLVSGLPDLKNAELERCVWSK